jgi:hypothetical protein
MAVYFADDTKELSFGVQASNVFEVAQFSSTLDDVVVRMFTNNGSVTDNMTTGVAIGSSNYDKTATASNNLYLGHITGISNITPVLLMQDSKIAVNTVPYANYSLTIQNGTYTDTLTSPWITATNYDQTFSNISGFTYINNATVTAGRSNILGTVPFTINFNGNSSQYTYTLKFTSNNTTVSTLVSTAYNSNTAYCSSIMTSGTYGVQLGVTTNGVGTGSFYYNSNAGSFTVGAVDPGLGVPTTTWSTGSVIVSSTNTYISGIPYATSGAVLTISDNVNNNNTIGAINPTNILPYMVGLSNTATGTTQQYDFSYFNVATKNMLFTLLGSYTGYVQLNSVAYNLLYPNGGPVTLFMPNIFYVGSPFDEVNMPASVYSGMPITAATRMSIPSTQTQPAQNIAVSRLVTYPSNTNPNTYTQSSYDSLYSVCDGNYYSTATQILSALSANRPNKGTNYPVVTPYFSIGGAFPTLTIQLTATVPLTRFVINLANSTATYSSTAAPRVYVAWAGINGGMWYDTTVMYNAASSPGCAAATPTAYRYPISLPQSQTLASAVNVYVLIQFDSGYINQAGLSVSYS